ncbi:SRR1-like protein [Denticeps clupeoides]|uniref:SRR1-like domain-containing protein n=1 Tax=Denticeps clupeoides TaxID=299321 RepID=A0A8C4B8T3_9TELE|nr:SRR1-like protein isoform X2 [Denticeps clupeoides]XP_028820910.1 SRR1-like protein isoform X2 [Denticeps clupeoides]XP_028852903.1 SRR1-like protein [Denticeps clupeoides]
MACGEGWQVARRRKGAGRRDRPPPRARKEDADALSGTESERRIAEAVNELRGEEFWHRWRELITRCKASGEPSSGEPSDADGAWDCVCYGLGSFSSCVSARYQLAMLLLLLEALRVPVERCSVYDPVFTSAECGTLRDLGFTVLTENEEGKRAVSRPTLFYLMHCGKALYNNLLWRNWSLQALPKVMVIGNSFHGIQERILQRELQRDYTYLDAVMGTCEETALPCSPRFSDVFNDTALIRFPRQNLHKLPESSWTFPVEPQYQHCQDLEIIREERN